MNCKSLLPLVNTHGFTSKTSDQQDTFTIKVMKRIVTQAYVQRRGWSDYTPICSECGAVLLQKARQTMKNGRTKTTTKKFRNNHVAMVLGKHGKTCRFAQALDILITYGELK